MPDRLFASIPETWRNCMASMADVKELIPEFYTSADFLRNSTGNGARLPLGATQCGRALDDVQLPRWASSADDFVRQVREPPPLLESEHACMRK